MQEIPIKTLWQEKAWVADRILRKAQVEGHGITLKHGADRMTIPFEMLQPKYWQRGQEEYKDKYNRDTYCLYGIHFVPDAKMQMELFT